MTVMADERRPFVMAALLIMLLVIIPSTVLADTTGMWVES